MHMALKLLYLLNTAIYSTQKFYLYTAQKCFDPIFLCYVSTI